MLKVFPINEKIGNSGEIGDEDQVVWGSDRKLLFLENTKCFLEISERGEGGHSELIIIQLRIKSYRINLRIVKGSGGRGVQRNKQPVMERAKGQFYTHNDSFFLALFITK